MPLLCLDHGREASVNAPHLRTMKPQARGSWRSGRVEPRLTDWIELMPQKGGRGKVRGVLGRTCYDGSGAGQRDLRGLTRARARKHPDVVEGLGALVVWASEAAEGPDSLRKGVPVVGLSLCLIATSDSSRRACAGPCRLAPSGLWGFGRDAACGFSTPAKWKQREPLWWSTNTPTNMLPSV